VRSSCLEARAAAAAAKQLDSTAIFAFWMENWRSVSVCSHHKAVSCRYNTISLALVASLMGQGGRNGLGRIGDDEAEVLEESGRLGVESQSVSAPLEEL
jgi:hypothetical protein